MNIEEYQAPKVLFIKNVFISDCVLMDDLMERKLMDEANDSLETKETNKKYTKLPTVFTNISAWVKSTDILCWHCNRTFNDPPVFIPRTMEPNTSIGGGYIINTDGCFCSFNCAIAYIIIYYPKSHEQINKIGMLKLLFKEFYGRPPKDILPAPSKFQMIQYNGHMTSSEYGAIIKDLIGKSL